MSWNYTGALRRTLSRAADFAWMSNEDYGWVATLANGTNEIEEFSQPYVASIDLFDETQIYESIETIHNEQYGDIYMKDTGEIASSLLVYYTMLDKPFVATVFRGQAQDSEDETLKTMIGGPNFVGQKHFGTEGITTDNITLGGVLDCMQNDHWTPPQNMRARTPIFTKFANSSTAHAATTGIVTEAAHTKFEMVSIRQWWRASRLRRREKMAVGDVIKYQLIDT